MSVQPGRSYAASNRSRRWHGMYRRRSLQSAMGIIKQGVRQGRKIKPSHVRQQAEQPFHLLLVGVDEVDRAALARFFVPESLPRKQRDQALQHIATEPGAGGPGPE